MEAENKRPDYVTDGFHIYVWHEEFEDLYKAGKLKDSDPPAPPKFKELSPKEKVKLEEKRKKALKDAQDAVELFSNPASKTSTDDMFGAPPKS